MSLAPLPELPDNITVEQLDAALAAMGLPDSKDVRSLHLEKQACTVEVVLFDDQGKRVAAGDKRATAIVRLPIGDNYVYQAD